MKFDELAVEINNHAHGNGTISVDVTAKIDTLPIYHQRYDNISVADPFYVNLNGTGSGYHEGNAVFNLHVLLHAIEELGVDQTDLETLNLRFEDEDGDTVKCLQKLVKDWNSHTYFVNLNEPYEFKRPWNKEHYYELIKRFLAFPINMLPTDRGKE